MPKGQINIKVRPKPYSGCKGPQDRLYHFNKQKSRKIPDLGIARRYVVSSSRINATNITRPLAVHLGFSAVTKCDQISNRGLYLLVRSILTSPKTVQLNTFSMDYLNATVLHTNIFRFQAKKSTLYKTVCWDSGQTSYTHTVPVASEISSARNNPNRSLKILSRSNSL